MFNYPELKNLSENKSEQALVTKVVVELFRHSLKENNPSRPNSELLLTPEGRELAMDHGEALNPSSGVAVAGASLMDRAAETAMLTMLANEIGIDTADSLATMEEKVGQYLPVGKKLYRDERLGFALGKGATGEEGMSAFKGGRYLNWLTKDSDRQVVAEKDLITTSYLRQAGNIAELLERYQAVGNNFNRLINDKDKREKYGYKLERYLVSHQGVAESFIAKVLEIQEGISARDQFADALGNGWAENCGVHIEIINDANGQRSFATYQESDGTKKELLISPETLAAIIKEREDLEKVCQKD
jgi:hypothetical protein